MASSQDWKSKVRIKLFDVFQDEARTLSEILSYLDNEDGRYEKDRAKSENWEILISSLEVEAVDFFTSYAKSLVQDKLSADDGTDEKVNPSGKLGKPLPGGYDKCLSDVNSEKNFQNYARSLEHGTTEMEEGTLVTATDLKQQALDHHERDFDLEGTKTEIWSKLLDVFRDDPETLDKVLCHLATENAKYQDSSSFSYVWISLKSKLSSDNLFKRYAESLVKNQEDDVASFRNETTSQDSVEEVCKSVNESMNFGTEKSIPEIDDWKDEIQRRLIKIFEEDAETLVRILFYLDQESEIYKGDSATAPVWKTLKSTLHSDELLETYARRLAEDTRRAEKDETFRKTMNSLYQNMMDASDAPVPGKNSQGFDLDRVTKLEASKKPGCVNFARAFSLIPRRSQGKIMAILPKIVTNKQLLSAADEVVEMVNSSSGTLVIVALAAVQLGYDVVDNLSRWWKGEITSKRCLKNIMDSGVAAASGMLGGLGGAALGTAIAGPCGTFIGGVAIGMLSSQAASVLSDRLTQWLFGVPKEEALENAYKFLEVQMTASNHEINTAFRRLCLQHHPDKGGKVQDFHMVQLNMGVIKAARGEL